MTLRHLSLMVTGRQRDEWGRLAAWFAMFANANRDSKKRPRPFKPKDFDPFYVPPEGVKQLNPHDAVAAFAAAVGAKKDGGSG